MTEVLSRDVSRAVKVCAQCSFSLFVPVSELRTSTLGLYDDARYPGRSLLVYRLEHVESIEELRDSAASAFMADIQSAASAIRQVTGASRVNVALLGNSIPHLHAHLIPRKPQYEPKPDRPIWEDARPIRSMPATTIELIVGGLRQATGMRVTV